MLEYKERLFSLIALICVSLIIVEAANEEFYIEYQRNGLTPGTRIMSKEDVQLKCKDHPKVFAANKSLLKMFSALCRNRNELDDDFCDEKIHPNWESVGVLIDLLRNGYAKITNELIDDLIGAAKFFELDNINQLTSLSGKMDSGKYPNDSEQLELMRTIIPSQRQQIDVLQESQLFLINNIETLNKDLEDSQTSFRECEMKNTDFITNYGRAVVEEEQKNQALEKIVQELKNDKKELENQAKQQKSTIENNQMKLATLADENKKCTAELANAQEVVDGIKAKNSQLTNDLGLAQTNINKVSDTYERALKKITEKLSKMELKKSAEKITIDIDNLDAARAIIGDLILKIAILKSNRKGSLNQSQSEFTLELLQRINENRSEVETQCKTEVMALLETNSELAEQIRLEKESRISTEKINNDLRVERDVCHEKVETNENEKQRFHDEYAEQLQQLQSKKDTEIAIFESQKNQLESLNKELSEDLESAIKNEKLHRYYDHMVTLQHITNLPDALEYIKSILIQMKLLKARKECHLNKVTYGLSTNPPPATIEFTITEIPDYQTIQITGFLLGKNGDKIESINSVKLIDIETETVDIIANYRLGDSIVLFRRDRILSNLKKYKLVAEFSYKSADGINPLNMHSWQTYALTETQINEITIKPINSARTKNYPSSMISTILFNVHILQ